MTATPHPTLWYQSGAEGRLQQKRWLGLTSLVLCSATLLFCLVCCVAASQSTGWDGLGWVLTAFVGSWIGCGLGAMVGSFGAFPLRRRHRFAVTALLLNLLTGLGPITFIWVTSTLSHWRA